MLKLKGQEKTAPDTHISESVCWLSSEYLCQKSLQIKINI